MYKYFVYVLGYHEAIVVEGEPGMALSSRFVQGGDAIRGTIGFQTKKGNVVFRADPGRSKCRLTPMWTPYQTMK